MYKSRKIGRCIYLKQTKNNKSSSFIGNIATGFVWVIIKIGIFAYTFIKYVWYGILWPFILIAVLISKMIIKSKEVNVDKLKKESQKILEKQRQKEKKNTQEKIDTSEYRNENIKIEKKNLGYYINAVLTAIISVPKKIKQKFDNISLIKQAKNKKAFDTMTMLVDFSGDDPNENKGKRVTWEYVAYNQKGKKIKGYFDAYSRLDVQSFLLGEGLVVYSIRTSKWIQTLHGK